MGGLALFFLFLLFLLIFAAIGWVIFTQIRARRSGLPPPSWRSYIPFLRSGSGGGGSGFANFPSPRSSNPIEWIKDKVKALRQGRNRTAQGHYEGTGGPGAGGPAAYGGAGSRRARGMDPDEAWDTRVGNEADAYGGTGPGGYYEEQELGLAPTPGPVDHYRSHQGAALPAYGEGTTGRGRSQSRDLPSVTGAQQGLDTRYDQETGGDRSHQQQRALDPNNPFSDAHEASSMRGVSPRPMIDPNAGQGGSGKTDSGAPGDSPTERKSMFRESL